MKVSSTILNILFINKEFFRNVNEEEFYLILVQTIDIGSTLESCKVTRTGHRRIDSMREDLSFMITKSER